MKIVRLASTLLVLLVACDGSPTGHEESLPPATAIPLDIPSDDESVFAETRDFTIVGYFDVPLARPGDVRIELFAGASTDGPALRIVQSRVDDVTGITPRSALDFEYAAGQAWGPDGPVTDPMLMVMTPDLVAFPGGIEDPTNKVVVTRDYYAGVILGGVSRDFDTGYGTGGMSWIDLTAGTYTIRVTGLSGQLAGLSVTKRIEFGRTHAMLGRFSPNQNRTALLDFADRNGFRTYIDFFPGFFSHDGYSYEVAGRWMANNSIEVVNTSAAAVIDDIAGARNDVLLYNISLTSATNRIEIGSLVAHDLLGAGTTFHHYDIGEPAITFRDAASGEQRTISGSIVPFPAGDRLVVTRVEIRASDDIATDNLYDVGGDVPALLDIDLDDGVQLRVTDEFSVHGVVTPIAAAVRAGQLAHQYEMENAIDSVRYDIRDGQGRMVHTTTRAVGLGRRYSPVQSPEWVSTSVYEFSHELRIASAGGAHTVSMVGLDAQGREVPGATVSFTALLTTGSSPFATASADGTRE